MRETNFYFFCEGKKLVTAQHLNNITTSAAVVNIKNIIKFEMLFLSSFRTFLHISSHNANVLKFLRTLATARNIEHSPFKAFKNYYNKYVRKKMKLCW